MRILLIVFFSMLLFLFGAFLSFAYFDSYKSLIRQLYLLFTNDNISYSGKGFSLFPSYLTVISGGAYVMLFYLFAIYRTASHLLYHFLISLSLFFLTSVGYCFFHSRQLIHTCTICTEGKLVINRGALPFVKIFISALSIALIPSLIHLLVRSRGIKVPKNTIV